LAARIVYESTSGINDSHSLGTATVFVPKGDPPPGGWKSVALGHPATGIQRLIDDGYLVAATDYQGLGLDGTDHSPSDSTIGPDNDYHPFLDSTTEQFLAALKSEHSDFDLDAYRHGAAKDNWDVLTACWGPASQDHDRLAEQIGADGQS